ncbi:MAG TPA: DUF401 family protein [Thermotogota bacterium]|nr:DUF401 family protein [Thermotogota bacterium]
MSVLAVVASLSVLVLVQRWLKKITVALVAAVIVVVLFRFDARVLVQSAVSPLADGAFFKLLLTVFFIYLFSSALSSSGDAARFAASAQAVFDDHTAMAFLPLVIGFLPMPGGAMFTAPILKAVGKPGGFSNLYMMNTNYWFRHVMEFFWPVYPALFLLATMTQTPVSHFSLQMLPIFAVSLLSGWVLFNGFRFPRFRKASWKDVKGFWIVLFILMTGVLILGFQVEGYLALGINIAVYFGFRHRHFFGALREALKKWDVFLLLFLFFVYKFYLEGVGFPSAIAQELNGVGLSVPLMAFLLPFLMGLSTGLSQSAVGITAPLLLVMHANPVWIYFSAIAGVLLSPVHLCLVLTSHFFQTRMLATFTRVAPLLALTGVFTYWILSV